MELIPEQQAVNVWVGVNGPEHTAFCISANTALKAIKSWRNSNFLPKGRAYPNFGGIYTA